MNCQIVTFIWVCNIFQFFGFMCYVIVCVYTINCIYEFRLLSEFHGFSGSLMWFTCIITTTWNYMKDITYRNFKYTSYTRCTNTQMVCFVEWCCGRGSKTLAIVSPFPGQGSVTTTRWEQCKEWVGGCLWSCAMACVMALLLRSRVGRPDFGGAVYDAYEFVPSWGS